MWYLRSLSVILIIIGLAGTQPMFGCEIVVYPIRKEFRRASSVFHGRAIGSEELANKNKPNELGDERFVSRIITFQIIESWKGIEKGQVRLYSDTVCLCPSRSIQFLPGKEFLIHADKKGYVDPCNLYFVEKESGERGKYFNDLTKRLDSFWFRTWARIYPF